MAEEEGELDKPLIIFGRDVRKIPCFRDSYLYGIGSGIGSGLLVFLFTSKPRLSSHAGMGTFCTVTLSYWVFCRAKWAETKYSMGQIQGAYNEMLQEKERDEKIPPKVEIVEV